MGLDQPSPAKEKSNNASHIGSFTLDYLVATLEKHKKKQVKFILIIHFIQPSMSKIVFQL